MFAVPYWDHDYWGASWLWGLFMLISMILFWGGVITVVVLLLRRFGRSPVRHDDSATRILDERFARGEIDEQEYERRRTVLRR